MASPPAPVIGTDQSTADAVIAALQALQAAVENATASPAAARTSHAASATAPASTATYAMAMYLAPPHLLDETADEAGGAAPWHSTSTSHWRSAMAAATLYHAQEATSCAAVAAAHEALRAGVLVAGVVTAAGTPHRAQQRLAERLREHRIIPVFIPARLHQLGYEGFFRSLLRRVLHASTPELDYTMDAHSSTPDDKGSSSGSVVDGDVMADVEGEAYEAFVAISRLFADAMCALTATRTLASLHGMELCLVPALLRERAPAESASCLHIATPFPSSEIVRVLIERCNLLRGMLGADAVAFATQNFARQFVASCVRILGTEATPTGVEFDGRHIAVRVLPPPVEASAPLEHLRSRAARAHAAELARRFPPASVKVILAIDRCEAEQGTMAKLRVFHELLTKHKELRGKVVFLLAMSSPTPARIADNALEVRDTALELMAKVNGEFGEVREGASGGPIFFTPGRMSAEELAAMMARADVLLNTSLREGATSTPYHYIACRNAVGSPATVVMSEFTGSTAALVGAAIINPHDLPSAAKQLHLALSATPEAQREGHARLLESATSSSIVRWLWQAIPLLAKASAATSLARADAAMRRLTDAGAVASAVAGARRAVVVVDVDAAIGADAGAAVAASAAGASSAVASRMQAALRTLATSGRLVIAVGAGRREALARFAGDAPLILVAENGAFTRWGPECAWECTLGSAEPVTTWLREVQPTFAYFASRTPGSRLIQTEATVAWLYGAADVAAPGASAGAFIDEAFQAQQARDLAATLSDFLPFLPLVIDHRPGRLQVRPSGADRGLVVSRLLQALHGYRPLHTIGDGGAFTSPTAAAGAVPSLRFEPSVLRAALPAGGGGTHRQAALRRIISNVYQRLWCRTEGDSGACPPIDRVVLLADAQQSGYGSLLRDLKRVDERATELEGGVYEALSLQRSFGDAKPPADWGRALAPSLSGTELASIRRFVSQTLARVRPSGEAKGEAAAVMGGGALSADGASKPVATPAPSAATIAAGTATPTTAGSPVVTAAAGSRLPRDASVQSLRRMSQDGAAAHGTLRRLRDGETGASAAGDGDSGAGAAAAPASMMTTTTMRGAFTPSDAAADLDAIDSGPLGFNRTVAHRTPAGSAGVVGDAGATPARGAGHKAITRGRSSTGEAFGMLSLVDDGEDKTATITLPTGGIGGGAGSAATLSMHGLIDVTVHTAGAALTSMRFGDATAWCVANVESALTGLERMAAAVGSAR